MGCGGSTANAVRQPDPAPRMSFESRVPNTFDYGGQMCEKTTPVPTYYRMYGPATTGATTDQPWVVLVHGIGLSGCMNTMLAEDLASIGHNVLVYDLIGRGKSLGNSKLKYSAEEHDAQLWSLVDALSIPKPVTLVGTSMGGAIVTVAASKHPAWIHRCVMLVPAGLSPLPPLDFGTKLLITPVIGAALIGAFGKATSEKQVENGEAVRRDWHKPEDRPLAVHRFKSLYLAQNDIPGYLNALRKCVMNFPLRDVKPFADVVGHHTYPVDIILARHDTTLTPAPDQWKAAIPRSNVHWVDSGHSLLWEEPVDVFNTLQRILA